VEGFIVGCYRGTEGGNKLDIAHNRREAGNFISKYFTGCIQN
jgi:hypothetical protein